MSFASINFDRFAKPTRRAKFLEDMDRILPWQQLCEIVRPRYPTGDGGRPRTSAIRLLSEVPRTRFPWRSSAHDNAGNMTCFPARMESRSGARLRVTETPSALPSTTNASRRAALLMRLIAAKRDGTLQREYRTGPASLPHAWQANGERMHRIVLDGDSELNASTNTSSRRSARPGRSSSIRDETTTHCGRIVRSASCARRIRALPPNDSSSHLSVA